MRVRTHIVPKIQALVARLQMHAATPTSRHVKNIYMILTLMVHNPCLEEMCFRGHAC